MPLRNNLKEPETNPSETHEDLHIKDYLNHGVSAIDRYFSLLRTKEADRRYGHRSQRSPLAGVTVVVKGTQTGTSTNANGKFTITASVGQTLLFSYLGMDSQEIKVGSASRLNVQLKETTAQIEDLVVIGYGAVQRKDVIQEQSLKFHRTTCWPLPPPT